MNYFIPTAEINLYIRHWSKGIHDEYVSSAINAFHIYAISKSLLIITENKNGWLLVEFEAIYSITKISIITWNIKYMFIKFLLVLSFFFFKWWHWLNHHFLDLILYSIMIMIMIMMVTVTMTIMILMIMMIR